MNKPKFTPGPWIIDPVRAGDKEIFINQPGDSWKRLEATVSRDDCDSKMALANAHLIAAAPDMYDALAASLKFFNNHRHYEAGEDAYQGARAALAKAKGKSQ